MTDEEIEEYRLGWLWYVDDVIDYFSWQSRECTPREAVEFCSSLSRSERIDYTWQIDVELYKIQREHSTGGKL